MDCIVIAVVCLVAGAVGGASLIIYWWRADRKEVDAELLKKEKELAKYKTTYFKVEYFVSGDEKEFVTNDAGFNWCVVRSTSITVEFIRPLNPVEDAELITELCERIARIGSPFPKTQEANILDGETIA